MNMDNLYSIADEVDQLIFTAIEQNNMSRVKMLLRTGFSITKPNRDGLTPLDKALSKQRFEILDFMLDTYDLSAINITNKQHTLPLMIASQAGHMKFFEKWNRSGLSFDIRDSRGNTPLHLLAMNSYCVANVTESVRFLLQRGVKVDALDEHGKSCLHLLLCKYVELDSRSNNFPDILELLLEAGADVDLRSKSGKTALHYALAYLINAKWDTRIQCLLNSNADINIECNKGLTCIDTLITLLRQFENMARSPIKYLFFKDFYRIIALLVYHVTRLKACESNVSKKVNAGVCKLIRFAERIVMMYPMIPQTSSFDVNHRNVLTEKCKLEIQKMKEARLHAGNSVHKLFVANDSDLVYFASNEKFQQYLTSKKYCEDFPIYGYTLLVKYKAGCMRKKLLLQARNLFTSFDLPLCDLIVDYILKLLTNRELAKFIEAYDL